MVPLSISKSRKQEMTRALSCCHGSMCVISLCHASLCAAEAHLYTQGDAVDVQTYVDTQTLHLNVISFQNHNDSLLSSEKVFH